MNDDRPKLDHRYVTFILIASFAIVAIYKFLNFRLETVRKKKFEVAARLETDPAAAAQFDELEQIEAKLLDQLKRLCQE
jgi:hypothetical protein